MYTKITFVELVDLMAEATSTTKRVCELFLRELFATVTQALIDGETVKIKGIGTFKVTSVKPRKSVNVSTGDAIEIAGHNKLTFTPDKSLAEAVNQPFAQYLKEAQIKQAAAIASEHLEEEGDVLRLLFISSVPWFNYTEVSMPYPDNRFSNPNICWGRYKTEKYLCLEDGEVKEKVKTTIPVTLLLNHALVDGVHVGQFYDNLARELEHFDFSKKE